MDLEWEDTIAGEAHAVGADWAPALDGETLTQVSVTLLSGSIDLNVNPPAGFTELAGTVQKVWRSGGAPGLCRVMLTAETSGGSVLKQVFTFRVL